MGALGLLSGASSLFSGGQDAGPTNQTSSGTATGGPVTFGAHNLGRGSPSTVYTTASGGGTAGPVSPKNDMPLYLGIGAAALVAIALIIRK